MKRFYCLIFTVLFLFSLYACAKRDPIKFPVTFYYCNKDIHYHTQSGVISSEVRDAQSENVDLITLIRIYLKGPHSDDLYNPVSDSVDVISIDENGSVVKICFSQDFSQLSGLDLTLACACISKTVFANSQATVVEISAKDRLLDGQFYISMSTDDILLLDSTISTEG